MVLYFEELQGNVLKKFVNAKRVAKRYHNKNNSGGNFGIDIRLQNNDYYELSGNYDTKGVIRNLSFGKGYALGANIVRKDNYMSYTLNDLKSIMQSKLGVAPPTIPIKKVVSDRNKDAVVTMINGISFVDFTVDGTQPSGMVEARSKAKNVVMTKSEVLKKQGFKRVEFDSYGGYRFRNIPNKQRYVPITTMHLLRIMKR